MLRISGDEQRETDRERGAEGGPRPRESGPLPHRVRHRFPIFERLVYINSCSQGALSDSVRKAYQAYLEDWDEKGAPWEYWVERTETARAAFARLVGADPDEVAVTTSLSAGVSALASGLRYAGKRSKIVLTDYEFPTVGQIWHAQASRGARVVHVPAADDGTVPIDRFDRAIDDETLIVDFVAAGVLKYLLGSAGLGFLYCRRELVERFWPTSTGWFADEDVFAMDHRDYSPARTAARFQSGTPPIPPIYAGIAGIELMEEIGIAETREHVNGLNSRLLEGLDELRARVVTPRRPKRRGALIWVAALGAPALVAPPARGGGVTSSRRRNPRISAHCYNSVEDVDAVLASLARHRRLLAR